MFVSSPNEIFLRRAQNRPEAAIWQRDGIYFVHFRLVDRHLSVVVFQEVSACDTNASRNTVVRCSMKKTYIDGRINSSATRCS